MCVTIYVEIGYFHSLLSVYIIPFPHTYFDAIQNAYTCMTPKTRQYFYMSRM